jgi:hypothetical protein
MISVLLTKYYWVIRSRRIRWAGHVACMTDRTCAYRVLVGEPERKNHS